MTRPMHPTATTVFETPFFSIEAVPDRHGSVDPPYYRVVCGEGVVVLPLTDSGEFVMVEQYRPTLGATTLEFPAGGREPHEGECLTAARETHEETGYVCDFWVPIAPCRMLLNRTDHRDYFVLGLGARPDPAWRPSSEGTLPILLTRDRLLERARTDMFEHTVALAAFTLLDIKYGLRLFSDPIATIRTVLSPHGRTIPESTLQAAPESVANQV